MSATASLLLLAAIFIVFVGLLALLVVLLDKFFGELIRKAWDDIDRRSAQSNAGGPSE